MVSTLMDELSINPPKELFSIIKLLDLHPVSIFIKISWEIIVIHCPIGRGANNCCKWGFLARRIFSNCCTHVEVEVALTPL